jgi:hypothetical protein
MVGVINPGLRANGFEPPDHDRQFVDQVSRNRSLRINVRDGVGFTVPEANPTVGEPHLVEAPRFGGVDAQSWPIR